MDNETSAITFQELPLGAIFDYQGHRFTKLALASARAHETNWGTTFHWDAMVTLVALPEKPVAPWSRKAGLSP